MDNTYEKMLGLTVNQEHRYKQQSETFPIFRLTEIVGKDIEQQELSYTTSSVQMDISNLESYLLIFGRF